MTVLKFHGIVTIDGTNTPIIGGCDVINHIWDTFVVGGVKAVTVAIGDSRFSGDLDAWYETEGYSEYTPGDPAKLTVGPHNILPILERHEGKTVTMWIADEPINTLEDYPIQKPAGKE